MSKKTILIIIIIALVSFTGYLLLRKEELPFTLFEVSRGDIVQEIWETGRVQRGEKINLSFQNTGEIEKIYVTVNQTVEKGEALAKLNTEDLEIQLQEAKSSLLLAQLNLQKLLAGASPEEIKIAQTQVENAKISLQSAEKNLKNSYDGAITVLDVSYPQIYNTLDFIKEFIREYVTVYDRDARRILDARDEIASMEEEAKLYLEIAKSDSGGKEDTEKALSIMRNSLEITFNNLETVREIIDKSSVYRDRVSVSDKAFLDTQKANINSALTNIIASQQTISSMKLNLEAAKTTLQEAENRLDLVTAEIRQVDIDLYETQIKQAQARVQLYENQIQKSILRSPLLAQIGAINKKEGEIAQPLSQDAVMVLLPLIPFEIKTEIYEEDIVKIKVGDVAEITLPAFPGKTFKGNITFIDDTEKIIDGVIYYEVKIAFEEEPPEGIKFTMTADIVIPVILKENVLAVPREAIKRVEEKTIVEVFIDDLVYEREVEVGVRGDNMVEILSGLAEGEKVVIR